jgi:thiol-disulfide isomerase/thioredoxin
MGGAWYYEDQATCGRSGDTYVPDWSSRTTGFRCCADAEVAMIGGSLELVDDAAGLEKGASMPAFELKTLAGGSITREALEGKVTLVAFWASWCGPCRRELPALSKVHEQLKEKGFQVLAVNVDKEEALARRFLGDVTPPYPVVLDPTASLMGSFDVVAMPTSVLIGPDLTVVSRHEGYSEERLAEVRKEVEELLAGVSHEPG